MSAKINDIEFLQFLQARFCHELAGTVGAINNGIEILEENDSQELQKQAISLVKGSAKQAVNRLLFYRQAYGFAKNKGEADLFELKKLSQNLVEGTKITIDFNEKYMHQHNVMIDANAAKVIYNLIVVASHNLVYGGTIKIITENEENNVTIIKLYVTGENLKIENDKQDILLGKIQDLDLSTNNVHYYYTLRVAETINSKIKIDSISSKEIVYSFKLIN